MATGNLVGGPVASGAMADEAELTRRILELERRMDLLFDHLKVEGPRLLPQGGVLGPEVRELLAELQPVRSRKTRGMRAKRGRR